ncbi:MAG TPA: hypothetical protein VF596_20875 [Pyrinomonadaceae bacterium]|jgi:hypothetical protein
MPKEELENDICIHIFTVSAAMVGVCLTVIGLFRAIPALISINTIGDDLLVVDASAFLISCLLSYFALRTRGSRRKYKVERAADVIFIGALCLMTIICGLLTYAFI